MLPGGGGYVDKARELLKHGRYDVNCRGIAGWTPLHGACTCGHVDMVRMLISKFHADTTLQTVLFGDTPCGSMLWERRGSTDFNH